MATNSRSHARKSGAAAPPASAGEKNVRRHVAQPEEDRHGA